MEHQHYVQDWESSPVTQAFSHCVRKNHNTHTVFLGGAKYQSWDPVILRELIRALNFSYRTSAFKSFLCFFHTTDGNVGFPHPKLVVLPPGYLFFESRFFFRFLHLLMWDSLLNKQSESLRFSTRLWDDSVCSTVICIFMSIRNSLVRTLNTKMTSKGWGETGIIRCLPISFPLQEYVHNNIFIITYTLPLHICILTQASIGVHRTSVTGFNDRENWFPEHKESSSSDFS